MALKIIAFFEGPVVQTQVRDNPEFGEYIVEFWHRDNVYSRLYHAQSEDYHTSDKQDALDTACLAANDMPAPKPVN